MTLSVLPYLSESHKFTVCEPGIFVFHLIFTTLPTLYTSPPFGLKIVILGSEEDCTWNPTTLLVLFESVVTYSECVPREMLFGRVKNRKVPSLPPSTRAVVRTVSI